MRRVKSREGQNVSTRGAACPWLSSYRSASGGGKKFEREKGGLEEHYLKRIETSQ